MTYGQKQKYFLQNRAKGDTEILVKQLAGKVSRKTIFDALKNDSKYLPAKHQLVIDTAFEIVAQ
ncbi:MAG: hypothetical protein RLZZ44_667 [Bacteroidota bacterium]|jgi:hypothetical protein